MESKPKLNYLEFRKFRNSLLNRNLKYYENIIMKSQTKAIIKGGLFGGIVYALGMAGFDYCDGESFNIWKFIFNSSFFVIFMAFMTLYNLKKQAEKEKN